MSLKVGNYVKVPRSLVEEQDKAPNFRNFLTGKIIDMDNFTNEIKVRFYDYNNIKSYFYNFPKEGVYPEEYALRAKIISGERGYFVEELIEVIDFCENIGGYNYYYCILEETGDIIKVNEKDLKIDIQGCNSDPLDLIKNYECHNPVWYKGRSNVSKASHRIKNAPRGLELLLSSRVYLLKHQVSIIMNGLSRKTCRLMLADEVGLGKTIEAIVIYKGLLSRSDDLRTLIVVPRSISRQWQNELSYKFWTEVSIWDGESLRLDKTLIVNLEDINKFRDMHNILDYGLLIVDETHRLLRDSKTYDTIYEYSKEIENILLLSATPIQQRKSEYFNLLKLLKPNDYKDMDEEKFELVLDKGKVVKDSMYPLIRDLEYYIEDEMAEDYIEEFEALNEILRDEVLEKLIEKINPDSSDQGLEIVKIIISYISNTYEVERDILRTRRADLDKFSKRNKEVYFYTMSDSLSDYYEMEVYTGLVNSIKLIKDQGDFDIKLIKEIYGRFFSSPWALKNYILSLNDNSLNEVIDLIDNWMDANLQELNNMEYYEENPDEIKGRLLRAIDILDQEYYDKKVVIFSNFTETSEVFARYLKLKVGEEKVVKFCQGMDERELEENVDKFQNDNDVKFLVSDKSGGEGRNFQMADAIFHIDLPWSPVDLEQRIGRLDRIGRNIDKDVESVIILSEFTVEEDLFKLWDKGLNIFNESLSGIEIALNDIEQEIEEALYLDPEYGLKNSIINISEDIKTMVEAVDKEQMFDSGKVMDKNKYDRLDEAIKAFEGKDAKLLEETMKTWSSLVGMVPLKEVLMNSKGDLEEILTYKEEKFSINSAKKALLVPPPTREALSRSKREGEIRGSFSKDLAINREDLILFSPGDEIYDSINKNAMSSFKGRSAAFAFETDINWIGFVFKWNISFDKKIIIESGLSPEAISYDYKKYLPLEQFESYHKFTRDSDDASDSELKMRLESWLEKPLSDKDGCVHLGKNAREQRKYFSDYLKGYNKNIDFLRNIVPEDFWTKAIDSAYKNSKNKALEYAKNEIKIDNVTKEIENLVISEKARNIFFEKDELIFELDKNSNLEREIIIKGLENPIVELDSVALLWMVKNEDEGL